jgi:hypothetical protein
MERDETPINAKPPRAGGLLEAARWRVEDTAWGMRRYWLWPLQDRFDELGRETRVALAGGSAVIAGLALVLGLALAGGGSGSSTEAAPTVAVEAASTTVTTPAPAPKGEKAEPTLQGAPPVFKPEPAKGGTRSVAGDEAKSSDPKATEATTTSSSSAATAKISSDSTAKASSSAADPAEPETVPGRPAGPKAIAVARRFSQAFVVYETGGEESDVRKAFATTTTPALAKALLRRPPRLPADVKVPKAKVVTVVPGPSREGVYTLSVSLLRVGVTSELRLEMERLKDEGWRVTNVLG